MYECPWCRVLSIIPRNKKILPIWCPYIPHFSFNLIFHSISFFIHFYFLFNFILAFQWSKLISDTLKHIGCSSRPQVSACTTSNSRFTNWSRWLFSSKCINLTSESHCLRNFQALQALLLAPQWVAIFLKLLRYDWQLTQRDYLSACFWITLPVGDMFLKQSKSVELPEDYFWRPRARYWDFSKGAPSDEF